MEARSAEGVGLGRGAVVPPQYWGLGALPPENFQNLTVQICSFFHDFKTEIAYPSEISIAFCYFT